MSLLPETKNIQSEMALYCRTGNPVELPGTTPNRFHHYRRLVYNIIQENLESSFPIAFEFIEEEKWQHMLNDFFSKHNCQSYQVWQVAGEFYEYAVKNNFTEHYQIPFLNDLLKFEWEEMVVYNMEDVAPSKYKTRGDVLNDLLILNPEHKLFQLKYPVHLYKPTLAVEKAGSYFILLYREQETGKVQFVDLSVWFALVIEQLGTGDAVKCAKEKINNLLNEAPKLFGNIDLESFKKTTLEFIDDLKNKKFILGFKK